MIVNLGDTARAFALCPELPASAVLLGTVTFADRKGALVRFRAGGHYALLRDGCTTHLPQAQTDAAVDVASQRPDQSCDTALLNDLYHVALGAIYRRVS